MVEHLKFKSTHDQQYQHQMTEMSIYITFPTWTVLQNTGATEESPVAAEEGQVPVAVANTQMVDELH